MQYFIKLRIIKQYITYRVKYHYAKNLYELRCNLYRLR